MQHRFSVFLTHKVIHAKKNKKVEDYDSRVLGILEGDLPEMTRLDAVHKGIEDFYRNSADGYGFEWWADKENGIAGKLQFASTDYLFSDPGLYDDEDNEDLQYFRPLDYPTPESYVGFIISTDEINKSLFYMSVSDYELQNLDLDYEGYTQMALEARVFNHWQRVLLFYMDGEGVGASETETFKAEMPKIFADWRWENFIEKFESLRLSKKINNH